VQGTPSFFLKDQLIDGAILVDPAGFAGAVAEARK
jgi:hypothetical protein